MKYKMYYFISLIVILRVIKAFSNFSSVVVTILDRKRDRLHSVRHSVMNQSKSMNFLNYPSFMT